MDDPIEFVYIHENVKVMVMAADSQLNNPSTPLTG